MSITGVGSSALGSVAFAWNLSVALGRPVAAIVPGYGVADVVQQALGGWYGFGLTAWIKKMTQEGHPEVQEMLNMVLDLAKTYNP